MKAVNAALDIVEDGLRPDLDSRVYIEPKDNSPASEDERQTTFVASMRRLAKRCDVAANTNAAKRSQWAAAKVKREGLVKGRNDLDVKWPGGVALIEFKNGRTMPDADQVDYLNRMVRMGFPVAVIRTPAGGFAWLHGLGAPVPAVIG